MKHEYSGAIREMKEAGNGFERSLGMAAERATSEEFRRLIAAFPEIFGRYWEIAASR